jgi:ankyrin repeat protein
MKTTSFLIMLLWALTSLCMERTISLSDFAEGLRQRNFEEESRQRNREVIKSYIAMIKSGKVHADAKDHEGSTALMYAVRSNAIEEIAELIEAGANVNAKDNFGFTALIHAAMTGTLEALKELLKAPNIDVNKRDNNGDTALIYATEANAVEAIKALIEAGADLNATDKDGNTALMVARKLEALKELLKTPNIDVNTKGPLGMTALMNAAAYNTVEVLKELLDAPNIDVHAKDNDGKTALSHAIEQGHENAALLLWAVGADNPEIRLNQKMEQAKAKGLAAFNGIRAALKSGNEEALRMYQDQGFSIVIRGA